MPGVVHSTYKTAACVHDATTARVFLIVLIALSLTPGTLGSRALAIRPSELCNLPVLLAAVAQLVEIPLASRHARVTLYLLQALAELRDKQAARVLLAAARLGGVRGLRIAALVVALVLGVALVLLLRRRIACGRRGRKGRNWLQTSGSKFQRERRREPAGGGRGQAAHCCRRTWSLQFRAR